MERDALKTDRRSVKRLYPSRSMQLVFKHNKPVVGRIHSISTRGVSVVYAGKCLQDMESEVAIKMALDLQSKLVVDNLLAKPVYNIPTLTQGETFRGEHMRLCGFEYVGLSPVVEKKIDRLITSAH